MMNRNGKQWRKWVRVALVAVLAADALLLYANWSSTDASSKAAAARLAPLRLQEQLLGADVKRVAAIRARLSDVQRNASKFYGDEFLPAGAGYSTIVGDLSKISKASGLRATNVTFKERQLESRGVTEVTVSATVEGDYVSVVRFINGLERSENFYLLDSLGLASSTGGSIKLNLQLRTYFR
jgi:Tfp pilus assembly protein PilO